MSPATPPATPTAEDRNAARLKLIRTILALVCGGAYVGGQAAGYDYGAQTNLGLDAGLLRDLVVAGFASLATFWPQASKASVLFKSLVNDPKVQQMATRLEALELRVQELEKLRAAQQTKGTP